MRKFWLKPLKSLDPREWEALCDGCAKCCNVIHLETKAQTGQVCRLLDRETNRCTNYAKRFSALKLEDGYRCRKVSMRLVADGTLPDTCAYVRRFNGQELEPWQIAKARENYGKRGGDQKQGGQKARSLRDWAGAAFGYLGRLRYGVLRDLR